MRRDKGRVNKDQYMCPAPQITGPKVQDNLRSRTGLPPLFPRESHRGSPSGEKSLRDPSSLKLRLTLLALPIPYTNKVIKIPSFLFSRLGHKIMDFELL